MTIRKRRAPLSPEVSRRQAGGFTLIELMLAIAIMALIFTGIFAVIRTGVNTQMFVREMSDAGRIGPAILSQVSEDLRNAYFYNMRENDCFLGQMVDTGGGGRADRIHFVTTRGSLLLDPAIDPDEQAPSPITEVSYLLKEEQGGFYGLYRREQPLCDEEPFKGGYIRLICDRIVSWKVQYTGWDFGPPQGGEAGAETARGRSRREERREEERREETGTGLEGALGRNPEEGPAELVWEDEWDAKMRGALPVAVKVELVLSPDIDPEVMKRMSRAGRLAELDKSYVHIVLLPQYREDPDNMRETYAWDGTIAEPTVIGGGRRGGRRGLPPAQGQDGAQGGTAPTNTIPLGNQNTGGGNNPFLDILRGGGNNR